jgi:ABC-type branched-subunit amino acid transport system permease subunit
MELLRPIAEARIASIGLLMILIPVFRPQGLFSDLVPTFHRLWTRVTARSSLTMGALK